MDAVGAGGAAVCVGVGGGCCCCCGGGGASVLDGAPFDAGADVGAPSPAPSFLAASLIAPSLLRCHRFANRPIRFFLRFQNKKKKHIGPQTDNHEVVYETYSSPAFHNCFVLSSLVGIVD